ncbi:hypothetical protein PC119_g12021 [Phytophthora cactorum]|nr:hypothetical protein PC119_g12021 [Phytophthora cactorum]
MLGTAYAYTPDGLYNHFWTQDFGRSDTEHCDDGSTPTTSTTPSPSSNADQTYNSTSSGGQGVCLLLWRLVRLPASTR